LFAYLFSHTITVMCLNKQSLILNKHYLIKHIFVLVQPGNKFWLKGTWLKNVSNANNLSSCLFLVSSRGKPKRAWTKVEVNAVMQHFRSHISKRHLASMREFEVCKRCEHQVLQNIVFRDISGSVWSIRSTSLWVHQSTSLWALFPPLQMLCNGEANHCFTMLCLHRNIMHKLLGNTTVVR